VKLENAVQTSLIITPREEPEIIVDNLEVAQLLIHKQNRGCLTFLRNSRGCWSRTCMKIRIDSWQNSEKVISPAEAKARQQTGRTD
jgi:hypothetical protein